MNSTLGAGLAALLTLHIASTPGLAQDARKSPANPVGAGWAGQIKPNLETAGATFDERQMEAIGRVSAYFNGLADLKGQFIQTSPDAKRQRGRIFVKRPGRFRFDYALPSRQIVMSDGIYLAVQDLDIKTDERFELDRTPFRLLLRNDVDLVRDARILDVQEAQDLIIITLQDKSPDAPGKIKLILTTAPEMELKEWVTTDPQNLETRVELINVDRKEPVDAKLFEIRSVALERLQQ